MNDSALQSPILARIRRVSHGFSTRLGGVSTGPYASLDLTPGAPEANRRQFATAIGLDDPAAFVEVNQVHGTTVLDAEGARGTDADGLITARAGVAVGVRTADCAPVLIAAVDARLAPIAVAAVHAGWRGATAGILRVAVEALLAKGAAPSRLFFAIGPAISKLHFEVGPEVVEAARASLDGDAPPVGTSPKNTPHLDLVELLVMQLERLGIERRQVDVAGACTFQDESRFYSHRRDRGVTGRHLSAIYIEKNS